MLVQYNIIFLWSNAEFFILLIALIVFTTQSYSTVMSFSNSFSHAHRDIEHKVQERKMALFTQLANLSHTKESYLVEQIDAMERRKSQLTDLYASVIEVRENVLLGMWVTPTVYMFMKSELIALSHF